MAGPNVYYYPLKLLSACGLHPDSRSMLLNLYFCVNYVCFWLILTLASVGVATTINTNIFHCIENVQTMFLYIHLLGKYPTLFVKKPALARLLERRSRFWPLADFARATREECESVLTTTAKFARNFIIVTFFVIMNFFLQPILTGELPVRVYVPRGWFHYINLLYWYLIPAIMGGVYGSDLIFCALCVPVMIQFKLLASKVENLKLDTMREEDFHRELRSVVDHQNFLIEYCNEINRFNNPIFLNQVIVSAAIICMQSFIVSQKEFLLPNKLKCLGYCLMEVMQTAIYCFNAELLSEASEKVGTAAYNSLWYLNDSPEIRKSINLVILRSQRKIVFNGFGLVLINLKTFTQIFKTALSFYSYLTTMVSYDNN